MMTARLCFVKTIACLVLAGLLGFWLNAGVTGAETKAGAVVDGNPPPRNERAFRIKFMLLANGKKTPAVYVRSVTISRGRSGATFRVRDGLLNLDISEGKGIDKFRTGEKFRIQFHGVIARQYETPPESVEYTVGKAGGKPLEIILKRRTRTTITFDIKTKDGKKLPEAVIYFQKKGGAWTKVNGREATVALGQYVWCFWQYGYTVVKHKGNPTLGGMKITCALKPARKIRITAVDAAGKPLSGAQAGRRVVAGRLEYGTRFPVPRTSFLQFNSKGVAEVFYDPACPGMLNVVGEGMTPVILPVVASQTEYKVTLVKADPIAVKVVAGDHKKALGYDDRLRILWVSKQPFRAIVNATPIKDDSGQVHLAPGVYTPCVQLASGKCPPELMTKAVVFKKVIIAKDTKSVTIEAKAVVPYQGLLD